MLKFDKCIVYLSLSYIFVSAIKRNTKNIEIMKITTEEIYKLASKVTEKEIENVVNRFDTKEEESFNQLVKLGDSRAIALFTVIAEKYNKVEVSEMYNIAYNS